MQHLSESVYMGLNKIVGTPQEVAMRRDVVDFISVMLDNLEACCQKRKSFGSFGEGFRLKGSDQDQMIWRNDHRVIWSVSQIQYYKKRVNVRVLILADNSDSLPGYTLLRLPSRWGPDYLLPAYFKMNGRYYISSTKFKDIMLSMAHPNATLHGPCNLSVLDGTEFDEAYCFACDFWPPIASPWIDRCNLWPKSEVIHEIIKKGCHIVAVGHKLGNHENREWRISFSFAEQKLVYSMSHCQFLTYGLLKLFLNEVINFELTEGRKLLCSYHMKTAIFWVLQENKMSHWCPQNLVECFWVCFKLILKWVYEGVCPNFFIPENNMFLTNIYGDSQAILFVRLYTLYERGVSCLLQSPSIRPYIIRVLCNPRLSICLDEGILISEYKFDYWIFSEIFTKETLPGLDLHCFIMALQQLKWLSGLLLSRYQVVMLQGHTIKLLRRTAFIIYNLHTLPKINNIYSKKGNNKVIYIFDKISCHMLKLASKLGCISDMLYLAMYYYQTCRYREALSVIEITNTRFKTWCLMSVYFMNTERQATDRERYAEIFGGLTLSKKFKQTQIDFIVLHNRIMYISDLETEQRLALQNSEPILFIPPFIFLFMLEFLCYRHVDSMRAQLPFNKLQYLVTNDLGMDMYNLNLRDISWQILGICQQINGDLQAALYSYQQSLRQYPCHKLQTAIVNRIESIMILL